MKFDIKKIIRGLDIGEYAEEYKGLTLHVWVNPDRGFIKERDELGEEFNRQLEKLKQDIEYLDEFRKYTNDVYFPGLMAWFSKLWSQGDNADERWSVDELKVMDDTDPALSEFMKKRSLAMIVEHRAREKKS